ncbi:GTP pyrophosphokinase [Tindallia californiensis]|uniref:Putative GTP pyrophosphokinase n=1 Tax=Tindallia californiensis TaxID=159292 RepID=A0A1H3MAE3_9FIRM|nr:GTP pyrophosphokinase family protein [Tindallia californiensis]SDY73149.1 putative GTP pyrophosphokinase [Tindallia californiensis]
MEQPQKNLNLDQLETFRNSLARFMMYYKFGMQEVSTKIDILKQEFQYVHSYNPIEHVKSRLKTPQSIIGKAKRKNYDLTIESIRENIRDIAGIRIVCAFTSDIYRVAGMVMQQKDLTVVDYKDYIDAPKSNGYQSLHLVIQVPVFMSDRVEQVYVELQIRTIAMDFWASLEHKIYYKYDKDVPQKLRDDLKEAADTIACLDKKMEKIHKEMQAIRVTNDRKDKPTDPDHTTKELTNLSMNYLSILFNDHL